MCLSCRRKKPIPHGTPQGRDLHRHRGEPVCDPCREAWNRVTRERLAAARARGKPRPRSKPFAGICRQCGAAFRAQLPQPYCSRRCGARSRGKSSALVYVGPVPHRRGFVATTDCTPRRPRLWRSGPCAWCGQPFTALAGLRARYCSKRCLVKATKAKHDRRFRVSPRVRLMIYERDGWVCQLCGDPADRDADYLDDWAPSLDHIEPQSFALIPDHSPRNLRTAHRWCNGARGNGTYAADLFGEVTAA